MECQASTLAAATASTSADLAAAWVTTGVLAVVIALSAVSLLAAAALLSLQALVLAIGAAGGPRRHPYARLYARLAAPRLGPVREREPFSPLRFAQLVGLVFALAGLVGFSRVFPSLVSSRPPSHSPLRNAAFGICLGRKVYPLAARLRPLGDRA